MGLLALFYWPAQFRADSVLAVPELLMLRGCHYHISAQLFSST